MQTGIIIKNIRTEKYFKMNEKRYSWANDREDATAVQDSVRFFTYLCLLKRRCIDMNDLEFVVVNHGFVVGSFLYI